MILNEYPLSRWSFDVDYASSTITTRRSLDPGTVTLQRNAKIDVPNGILTVPVITAKDQGKWNDVPKYEPKIVPGNYAGKTYDSASGGSRNEPMQDYRSHGPYLVKIQWEDWDKLLRDYYQSYKSNRQTYLNFTKKDLINKMINDVDVKFDCNCPAYYWQGIRWYLTTINSAIKPLSIASEKWIPKHFEKGAQNPVCKHIRSVLLDVSNPDTYLMGKLYREIQKDHVFNKVSEKVFGETDIVLPNSDVDYTVIPNE
jgi:hypothetical protein